MVGGIQLETLTIEWEVEGQMPVIDLSAWAQLKGNSGGRPVGIDAGNNNRNLTVRGLVLIGHPNGDSYGVSTNAGYVEGVGFGTNPTSTLTIEFCKLVRWADGIKATIYNREISCFVRYSTIEDCTAGSLTHGIYWPASGELHALGCTFRTTVAGLAPNPIFAGHLLKSRARVTTVKGCLFDMAGGGAACIETPNGGELTVQGNVILKYNVGDASNPPIKYGFEEVATEMSVSLSGAEIPVGETIVGSNSRAAAVVRNTYNAGTRIVYQLTTGGRYFDTGETITVAGVVRGTIVSRAGSPDGTARDGRRHSVNVCQNTVRNEQPSAWSGATSTAIGMLWIRDGMTDDAGNRIALTALPTTVRNNIVGDAGCGARTLLDFPDNTAVARSAISDRGVHSGGPIAGNPAVNDAAYAWAGEFTVPRARTDTFRGGV